jgi:hypothetical protein
MSVQVEPPLTVAELGRVLEAVDPGALLVAPRLLRRIIKRDRKLTHLGLQVPHRKSYVIDRETLLSIADAGELGVPPERALPVTVLLLARPEPDALAAVPRGQALVKFWRLLFHARIHQALAAKFASDSTEAEVRRRIHSIGSIEFAEARAVMRQDKFLLPPYDDATAYEEFAAFYLELSHFAAALLPRYFPAIEDFGRVDQVLAEDVDAAALFAATRLAGAPEPNGAVDDLDHADEPAQPAEKSEGWPGSDRPYLDLVHRADRAAAAGNVVRAAIRLARAARVAPPAAASEANARAATDLDYLVERLGKALDWSSADADSWRRALPALLPRASRGIWPVEARLLYDLQKICVDHERPIYAADVVEWAYSLFQRPLARPLPNQPLVLAVKHLRSAVKRLSAVRVTNVERQALERLLHDALQGAEHRLRERFRPPLREALDHVGLRPLNFPELMGEAKFIEELLDRITERGFLNMSDVRDALARNQLKLPNLSGPRELLGGDPLIRLNRQLATSAPGIYRRGEFYARWLQRGSALAFGTRPGQWLILFIALPFLGAFATIVFAEEMLHLLRFLIGERASPGSHHAINLARLALPTGIVGVFYLLVIHWPAFRRELVRCLHGAWRVLRAVFIDLPSAALRLPAVRRLLASRPLQYFVNYVLKPIPAAVVIGLVCHWLGAEPVATAVCIIVAFAAAALVINSRLGVDLEEALVDQAVRNWDYLRSLVPGVLRLILDVFKTMLEGLDRLIYTVDEWLRFRGGQSRLTFLAKTVLGFVWFLVTYVVRLFANVFIEPTVNPIKHFPAVTVAAKFLVPFWGIPFQYSGLAFVIAMGVLHSLPGAAGFLVWEFKENWRLYRSNRPRTLRAVMIGHHGETMVRLMRPGFHSGTLPKLFAKLRRAERRAERRGTWKAARRLRETLHHVEASIGHFAERELIAFLKASKGWAAAPVELVAVEAGSNRVRVRLSGPPANDGNQDGDSDPNIFELHFEQQGGRLLAHIARPGWLPRLSADQTAVFVTALLGCYHKAGVNLVREQIEAALAPACPPYDLDHEALAVWPSGGFDVEVKYDLSEAPLLHPHGPEGGPAAALPILAANQIIFDNQAITWEDWVAGWDRDQGSIGNPQSVLPLVWLANGVRVGENGSRSTIDHQLKEGADADNSGARHPPV